jgi:hypothetical protein
MNTGKESEGFFLQFIKYSKNIHPVYQEFAQNQVKQPVIIQSEEILPECGVFQGMTIGASKSKMANILGEPQNTFDLVSGISLWAYPEKSTKIYFERDKAVFFVHTNPVDCRDEIFNSYLDKSRLHLKPEFRNYYSFGNGIIAGDSRAGLSLFGKFGD